MADAIETQAASPVMWKCPKCEITKAKSDFSNHRLARHGVDLSACKRCKAAYNRQYRDANKETLSARRQARYQANPGLRPAIDAAYRARHPDKIKAKNAAAYAADPGAAGRRDKALRASDPAKARARDAIKRARLEQVRYQAAYRDAHRSLAAETTRRWRKDNPEHAAALRSNRKAKKRGALGNHTKGDIAFLMRVQKAKCAHKWCRKSLRGGRHVDHGMPIALGGSNDRRNLQLLCPRCNLTKSARHPVEFAQLMGMLL